MSDSLTAPSVISEGTLGQVRLRRAGEQNYQRIALVPLVAVLCAYCAGGPFGFEAMISTSGPGMSLLFIAVIPWLFSVPISLATGEMAAAMPVQGGFYRWTRAAFGDFWGFQCGWWNWTGTFLMSGAYGVMLADYVGQVIPLHNRFAHWLIAFGFIVAVAYVNIRGIKLVGNMSVALVFAALIPVGVFTFLAFRHGHFNPMQPLVPPDKPWSEVFGVAWPWHFGSIQDTSSFRQ